jgi:hypothetical protein
MVPLQADDDPTYTRGLFNCRWWNVDPDSARVGYVMGFSDAMNASADSFLKSILTKGPTYKEYADGVTEFCKSPENRSLPIFRLLLLFTRKLQGASAKEINSSLESARVFYSQPAPKTEGKKQ